MLPCTWDGQHRVWLTAERTIQCRQGTLVVSQKNEIFHGLLLRVLVSQRPHGLVLSDDLRHDWLELELVNWNNHSPFTPCMLESLPWTRTVSNRDGMACPFVSIVSAWAWMVSTMLELPGHVNLILWNTLTAENGITVFLDRVCSPTVEAPTWLTCAIKSPSVSRMFTALYLLTMSLKWTFLTVGFKAIFTWQVPTCGGLRGFMRVSQWSEALPCSPASIVMACCATFSWRSNYVVICGYSSLWFVARYAFLVKSIWRRSDCSVL